jgi:hypothetical protein
VRRQLDLGRVPVVQGEQVVGLDVQDGDLRAADLPREAGPRQDRNLLTLHQADSPAEEELG